MLKQDPEFQVFQQLKGTRSGGKKGDSDIPFDSGGATPSEALEKAYGIVRETST